MEIKIFEFNPLGVNTYVLHDETRECVIVDASCLFGSEREELRKYIEDNELVVKHLINTHLHFDHIFGANFVERKFDVKMECHADDLFLLDNIDDQLSRFGISAGDEAGERPEVGRLLNEGDVVTFGNSELNVLHVPGHSPGSVVFYSEKDGCMFCGDVLFWGSIGRTDLPGGSYEQLVEGIKRKLLVLPDDTKVYSGHGPHTTIGYERVNNPYLS